MSGIQKKSLLGAGDVFLTRGKRDVKAPVQGEAAVRQEAAAGTPRGRGGAMRGNATTSQGKQEGGTTRGITTTRRRVKRLWHNKKPCNNQLGEWEVTSH